MKKVNIIAVGKIKEKHFADAIDEYKKRLSRFCRLNIIEIADHSGTDEILKESNDILIAVQKSDGKIDFLTDIGGALITSEELSKEIESVYINGADSVTFVIGGSRGVNEEVRQKANKKISFGRVTYPHQLMRVILLEQVYRAFTIAANMPYHK